MYLEALDQWTPHRTKWRKTLVWNFHFFKANTLPDTDKQKPLLKMMVSFKQESFFFSRGPGAICYFQRGVNHFCRKYPKCWALGRYNMGRIFNSTFRISRSSVLQAEMRRAGNRHSAGWGWDVGSYNDDGSPMLHVWNYYIHHECQLNVGKIWKNYSSHMEHLGMVIEFNHFLWCFLLGLTWLEHVFGWRYRVNLLVTIALNIPPGHTVKPQPIPP